MTRDETIKVLAMLKAAYPASYRNMTKDEATATVNIWASQFVNMPGEIVYMAVQKLISSSVYPPTIAEVKSQFVSLYWEAVHVWQYGKSIGTPTDAPLMLEAKKIKDYCNRYNASGNEPTLVELLGGMQNYLTEGKDRLT